MATSNDSSRTSRRAFIKLAGIGATLLCAPIALSARNGNKKPASMINETEHAFLEACRLGDSARVKALLEADSALLKALDAGGRSGFALALLNGHKPIGVLLKEAGYVTDLHESALDTDWKRVNTLLGDASDATVKRINTLHPIGGTAMYAAAAGGAGSSIWRIYAQGGNPNISGSGPTAETPLQKALAHPDLAIAEATAATLLGNATNANPPTNAAMPPLHLAAARGSYVMAEMLVRLGADASATNSTGKTAAQLADYYGHQHVWELLTNHDRIPRTCRTSRYAFNRDGQAYAAPELNSIPVYQQVDLVGKAHGNLEALQQLVKADPRMAHSVSTTSEMAVEAGAHMGRNDVVETLLSKGAPYSLPTAVMMNDIDRVRALLEQDANRIHERGAHDYAVLWYPILGGGNLEMMQLLLDAGAKVEEQHSMGTTALHWACMGEHIELVALLIEHGADVNRAGRTSMVQGRTPAQMTKNDTIVNYLKSNGAQ